ARATRVAGIHRALLFPRTQKDFGGHSRVRRRERPRREPQVSRPRAPHVRDGSRRARPSMRMKPAGAAEYEPGGMLFAGGSNEVADRVLHLHELLGHSRQILQMDVGGMPHATFLKGIELLG